VSYFLASEKPQKLFRASTDTGAKAGMSLRIVQKIQTALPPLPEQLAIAEALSDVDSLLTSLDRLIAKKRDLKQAAMQQLLTGQTRLPGFKGEWVETTLGEVATFKSGGTPSRNNEEYWNGEIPWISATSLRCFEIWRSASNVTEEAVAAGSKIAPLDSTLLLVRGSALHNEILCGLVTKRVCFNQDVKALIPSSKVFPRFLTWLITGRADDFLKLVSSAGNTAGVLDTKLLKAYEFLLPPLPEQTAIAAVLTEMDAELAVLEQRQAKTRALKQGMMQELLTGRTRLV
jgi:type I restriction enzyme S subunit